MSATTAARRNEKDEDLASSYVPLESRTSSSRSDDHGAPAPMSLSQKLMRMREHSHASRESTRSKLASSPRKIFPSEKSMRKRKHPRAKVELSDSTSAPPAKAPRPQSPHEKPFALRDLPRNSEEASASKPRKDRESGKEHNSRGKREKKRGMSFINEIKTTLSESEYLSWKEMLGRMAKARKLDAEKTMKEWHDIKPDLLKMFANRRKLASQMCAYLPKIIQPLFRKELKL
eukprot:CAMPEP_0167772336 /NCGR_PEP_ID=MMETSP0111_2-20121227/791_1 /TAXON_ID=91324 /ORGANISM="Lotharella globosa, Strain CCCM811" /LENGTH=231 /DNA_ID=CAMNT_0007661817 /DNA_START=501 /DNA_END=1196 /DNA_ORIENTATION=+